MGRESYVSMRGIASLVNASKSDGIPEANNRSTQYRACKTVSRVETPYGTIIKDVDLDGITFAVQCPLPMLHKCAELSHDYASWLDQAIACHPCSRAKPWNIILYQDGVNPSHGVSTNHSRKSAVFYLSFPEFGMQILSIEQSWFTLTDV